MKKKILLLSAIIICITTFASGTLAYFSAEDQVHNVITSGAVNIKIEEWQQTEGGLVSYPKEEPILVMPGVTVSKIVTVKNMEEKSYIRAKVELVIKDVKNQVIELSEEIPAHMIALTMNENDWVRKQGDEEWWYYGEAVGSEEATKPLFTEVVFSGPNMTNEYQNCTVEVIVKAQAVQTANNGKNVMEAAGWSAE